MVIYAKLLQKYAETLLRRKLHCAVNTEERRSNFSPRVGSFTHNFSLSLVAIRVICTCRNCSFFSSFNTKQGLTWRFKDYSNTFWVNPCGWAVSSLFPNHSFSLPQIHGLSPTNGGQWKLHVFSFSQCLVTFPLIKSRVARCKEFESPLFWASLSHWFQRWKAWPW